MGGNQFGKIGAKALKKGLKKGVLEMGFSLRSASGSDDSDRDSDSDT